jgi:dihydroorotase-like cyclic amidohydrolase
MILIRNGEVFSPCAMGRCDVLTGGRKILAIEKSIQSGQLPGEVEVIDAQGLAVAPGFVDGHQHFTGGPHPHPGDAAQHEHGKRRDHGRGSPRHRRPHPLR